MKRKGLVILLSGILLIGSATGLSFAYSKSDDSISTNNYKIEKKIQKDTYKDMIEIMKKNGFEDVAKSMKNNDYKAIDEFMNNITDEDYEKMIKIMKESGYDDMAKMMESMDKEQMIQMHNAMGGAENCHSDSSDMMNNF